MRFSIVIAAHNEGEKLARTVESSLESIGETASDFELIVADDASWDGSIDEVVARFPQVRVVSHQKRRGTSPTKHLGAQRVVCLLAAAIAMQVVAAVAFGDDSRGFSAGLGTVQVGKKWGFINEHGEIAISPKFDDARRFCCGLAAVKFAGKWGFIDTSGKAVIEPRFQYVSDFREGLSPLQFGSKFGYVDNIGRTTIAPRFDYACEFHEGLARIMENGRCVFIDHKGSVVVRPKLPEREGVVKDFSEGLAPFYLADKRTYGFIDCNGDVAIPARFRRGGNSVAHGFSCGRAPVCEKIRWGYVDKKGKTVIAYRFASAGDFSEGLALVSEETAGKLGFIDTDGHFVLPPKYDSAGYFSEGLAAVEVNGRAGYINRYGKFIIESPNVKPASNFCGGYASVEGPMPGWFGYIDKTGKYIWGPRKELEQ